jgi:hypothetical protein
MRNKGGHEDGNAWVLAHIVVIDVLFPLKLAAILKTCEGLTNVSFNR